MKIVFSPQRRDASLSISKSGDILTVNSEVIDFSVVMEGATLPEDAIDSEWIAGPVERSKGQLHLSLFLPHGPNPPQAVAFPQPVTVSEDGPIDVPSGELQEAGQ